MSTDPVTGVVQQESLPCEPDADSMGPLVDAIGTAQIVLIGEATHGTHEFYRTRAELTKALIDRKGFNLVAVEADWPDAYRINRWVRRNRDVVEFLEWLRAHNAGRPASSRVGFYGLDLYSLHASIGAVLAYLGKIDPEAAQRARYRYGCLEDFGEDPQSYGYAATTGLSRS
jgi:erythromycin esterase-like protein